MDGSGCALYDHPMASFEMRMSMHGDVVILNELWVSDLNSCFSDYINCSHVEEKGVKFPSVESGWLFQFS